MWEGLAHLGLDTGVWLDILRCMADEERKYSLEKLQARLGEANEEQVSKFVWGRSNEELVAAGQQVSTNRITTDATRLYGYSTDFYEGATEDQLDVMPSLSLDLLRVGVWSAIKGNQLFKARRAGRSDATDTQTTLDAVAEEKRTRALALRGVLYQLLKTIAAGSTDWTTKIDQAYGTYGKTEEAVKSLEGLEKLAREMLTDPTPELKAIIDTTRLSIAWLDRFHQAAEAFKEAAQKAGAVAAAPAVTQGKVDYWDGINLVLLKRVIDIFDAGHDADPTIPRLIPISLRNLFFPTRSVKTVDKTEEGEGGE
jgi:hypothetical protein